MYVDRLTDFADLMDRVAEQQLPFDMTNWFATMGQAHNCHTAACGAGWACRYEPFKKLGLTIWGGTLPMYDGYAGYNAMAQFFDISTEDAIELFAPDSYFSVPNTTAAEVAARARELLAS